MESKLARLEEAGLVDKAHLSPDDLKTIESLTDEEVDTLIRLRQKLGSAPAGKDKARPNIIV